MFPIGGLESIVDLKCKLPGYTWRGAELVLINVICVIKDVLVYLEGVTNLEIVTGRIEKEPISSLTSIYGTDRRFSSLLVLFSTNYNFL